MRVSKYFNNLSGIKKFLSPPGPRANTWDPVTFFVEWFQRAEWGLLLALRGGQVGLGADEAILVLGPTSLGPFRATEEKPMRVVRIVSCSGNGESSARPICRERAYSSERRRCPITEAGSNGASEN